MKNFSIWLDILIFFKTMKLIFNAKGATPKNEQKNKVALITGLPDRMVVI